MCGMAGFGASAKLHTEFGEGSTTLTEGVGHSVLRVERSSVSGCPRLVSVEEARGDIGRGRHTDISLTEPTVTIARNQVVDRVPDWAGQHNCQTEQQEPGAQAAQNSEVGGRTHVYSVRVQEDNAVRECVDLVRIQNFHQLLASGVRLEGGEIESSLLVVLDHPLDRRVAEVADTVEEDGGPLAGHFLLPLALEDPCHLTLTDDMAFDRRHYRLTR